MVGRIEAVDAEDKCIYQFKVVHTTQGTEGVHVATYFPQNLAIPKFISYITYLMDASN